MRNFLLAFKLAFNAIYIITTAIFRVGNIETLNDGPIWPQAISGIILRNIISLILTLSQATDQSITHLTTILILPWTEVFDLELTIFRSQTCLECFHPSDHWHRVPTYGFSAPLRQASHCHCKVVSLLAACTVITVKFLLLEHALETAGNTFCFVPLLFIIQMYEYFFSWYSFNRNLPY